MTDSLSVKKVVVEKEKKLEDHKGKKKPNWKLYGIIGSLFGAVLLIIFIVLGVRNESFGRRKGGVNVRDRSSSQQEVKDDATGAAGADRDGRRLKTPVPAGAKDGSEGENDADNNAVLQGKPPGEKVLDPARLTPQSTRTADPITDLRTQTEASRTTKSLADSSDAPGTNINPTTAGTIGTGSQQNSSTSQSEFSLPKEFIMPPPDDLSDEISNVIKNADNPTDFKNALNVLRRKAQVPKNLRKIDAANYVDNLVEKEMKRVVLECVMEGDEGKIKAALEKYHKAVLQTKAVVELPRDANDIKDVEMYRIVRKCLSEGTLSASDKAKLEDILSSPEETYTMNSSFSAQFLALKLKGCSEEEAADTVKAYFRGSDQTKKDYETFTWRAWYYMFFENFYENKGRVASWNSEYSLAKASLPHELRDEHLYRTDVKKLLLELISAYPSSLLENVTRDEIPLISTIRTAIASAGFPKDDPLFMAKFSRQLVSYIRDVGYKKVQEELNVNNKVQEEDPSIDTIQEINDVLDYCESLIIKYVVLVRVEPKDPRVTNLKEWKAYNNDPYNLDIIKRLLKAVSEIGLDPYSVHQYIRHTMRMQYYDTGRSTLLDSFNNLGHDLEFLKYM